MIYIKQYYMNTEQKLIDNHSKAFFILGWQRLEKMNIIEAQNFEGEYIVVNDLDIIKGLLINKLVELYYIEIKNDLIHEPYIEITKKGKDFLAR